MNEERKFCIYVAYAACHRRCMVVVYHMNEFIQAIALSFFSSFFRWIEAIQLTILIYVALHLDIVILVMGFFLYLSMTNFSSFSLVLWF